MRTTVTLEPDVVALIQKRMQERVLTFKQAVNSAIREGLAEGGRRPFESPSFRMGFDPTLPWDKALALAGELEDDALFRKLAARK
jgi:hypothetical protein